MNRPNITMEEAKAYISASKTSITKTIDGLVASGRISQKEADVYLPKALADIPADCHILVIAIRGYYKDSMGKPGENDRNIYDDAFVVIGPGYYKTFNGNTDPRQFKVGISQLLPGLHFFKQGLHGFAHGPYKAFRTANAKEITPVLRDGQNGIKEGITINLHQGGTYSTNSAGCQTVIADQWLEFQQTVYKLMNDSHQKVLPYLLIEA